MRAAFDTFYVLNADRKKIETAEEREALQRQLGVAIAPALFERGSGSDNK